MYIPPLHKHKPLVLIRCVSFCTVIRSPSVLAHHCVQRERGSPPLNSHIISIMNVFSPNFHDFYILSLNGFLFNIPLTMNIVNCDDSQTVCSCTRPPLTELLQLLISSSLKQMGSSLSISHLLKDQHYIRNEHEKLLSGTNNFFSSFIHLFL